MIDHDEAARSPALSASGWSWHGRNRAHVDPAAARVIQLLRVTAMLLATLVVSSCVDSTPETPGDAVMDYITAAQVGKESEASGRLCERLKTDATDAELATIDRVVHEASVFGEGTVEETDDSAVVALEVLFAPSPPGAEGDPWEAYMVKEDGKWKVCGFEAVDE